MSINWREAETIEGAGLHSHICRYCWQEFWCECEGGKTGDEACEECVGITAIERSAGVPLP